MNASAGAISVILIHKKQKHKESKKEDKKFIKKLNYKGITFPVQIRDIPKIEQQNEINVNVFGYDISSEQFKKHMELLLISEGDNKHYVLIKDFNRFMFQQTNHKSKKSFCMYCLQCFTKKEVLENHK